MIAVAALTATAEEARTDIAVTAQTGAMKAADVLRTVEAVLMVAVTRPVVTILLMVIVVVLRLVHARPAERKRRVRALRLLAVVTTLLVLALLNPSARSMPVTTLRLVLPPLTLLLTPKVSDGAFKSRRAFAAFAKRLVSLNLPLQHCLGIPL